jgi:hypothetical protein
MERAAGEEARLDATDHSRSLGEPRVREQVLDDEGALARQGDVPRILLTWRHSQGESDSGLEPDIASGDQHHRRKLGA